MLGIEKKFDGDRAGAKAELRGALTQAELPMEYREQAERALQDL